MSRQWQLQKAMEDKSKIVIQEIRFRNKLEFWCVFKGIENKSKKIRYVYAEELAERMKNLGREDLAAKCYQFIKNVYSDDQTTFISRI